jgi:hypothetical protein
MTRKEYFDNVWHKVWFKRNGNCTNTVRYYSSDNVANFNRLFCLVKGMIEGTLSLPANKFSG